MTTTTSTRIGAILAASGILFALAGCASPAPAAESAPLSAADSIEMTDAWVKSADEGMSAAFGQLTNDSDTDITVVSATTEASPMIELHETVANDAEEMTMREIDGGFVIPAGGSLDLEPGANHIMLMGLTEPLVAGEEVAFALTFSDDTTFEFTAPVKDYSGANENYDDGEGMDMEMDMEE